MISFRLSETEYEGLKKVCLAQGGRSLSDFARLVVCGAITSNPRTSHDTLEEIHREVQRLARILDKTSAPEAPQ